MIYLIPGVTETWREANFTLMSAETLISGGVSVMDGHCWGPSPMLIQDLANSPRAHSFWMEHLDRGDIYHIKLGGNHRDNEIDGISCGTSMFLWREVLCVGFLST